LPPPRRGPLPHSARGRASSGFRSTRAPCLHVQARPEESRVRGREGSLNPPWRFLRSARTHTAPGCPASPRVGRRGGLAPDEFENCLQCPKSNATSGLEVHTLPYRKNRLFFTFCNMIFITVVLSSANPPGGRLAALCVGDNSSLPRAHGAQSSGTKNDYGLRSRGICGHASLQ
jgi:hypothetical protein